MTTFQIYNESYDVHSPFFRNAVEGLAWLDQFNSEDFMVLTEFHKTGKQTIATDGFILRRMLLQSEKVLVNIA